MSKILVIGDSCRDVHVYGKSTRLCPDAPVPVFVPTYENQNLGMAGNVYQNIISLVEKAESIFKSEEAIRLNNKISQNTFNLNDFATQLNQMKDIGSISNLVPLIPHKISKKMKLQNFDNMSVEWNKAIISSMTKIEKKNPEVIDGSRRLRISRGSGRSLQDVNALLKKFKEIKQVMKKLKRTNIKNNLVMTSNYRKF